MSNDNDVGLYRKYFVAKTCPVCGGRRVETMRDNSGDICDVRMCQRCEGKGFYSSDPEAVYFVLRLDGDECARRATEVYADASEQRNPLLARDLRNIVKRIAGREATGQEAT